MNFTVNSISELWVRTFFQYIDSSIQSGKEYLLHEQNNIAVMAVHMADSVVEAFKARLTMFADSGTGKVAPSLADEISQATQNFRPQNIVTLIDQGLARFRQPSTGSAPAPSPKPKALKP